VTPGDSAGSAISVGVPNCCAVLQIRSAEPDDDAALRAIDVTTWSPDVTPAPQSEPQTPFFSDRHTPSDVIVAQRDGLVVGYAMLQQTIPLPSHQHVLELNGLAVAPGQQRRGVGRRLVEEAQHEARRRRVRKLSLRVLAPNTTARRLYESCGFTVEGILKGEFLLRGQLVDDVLMGWYLKD
jgi:ribosomal protein S18 acetylase RimI-like enzyme